MTHRLEIDGIQLEFGLRRILSDIYIKCETGRITGLVGRNGEGKTCLMNIVYGSLEPASKSIRFDNHSIVHAFKRPGLVQYLPQFHFIPRFLKLKRIFLDFDLDYAGFEKDFPEFKTKYRLRIGQLSGGERRLVEVYVIVKGQSQFVLLDEPFSYLMPLHIEVMKEILGQEKQKKGFLMTDHLYRELIGFCDDIYILDRGQTHPVSTMEDFQTYGYTKFWS